MNKQYDERQIWLNSKYSREALFILMGALFLNAIVNSFYGPWAEPMVEMIILVALPTLYFLTQSVFNDSYLSKKESLKKNAIYFGLLGLLMAGMPFVYIDFSDFQNQVIVNGQLSDRLTLFVGGTLFLVASLVHFIKITSSKYE